MIIGRGSGDFTTKYRPCTIEEVVGQDVAKDIVEKALQSNNVAPAYLFHGESGTGKTTLARIIALGVNCLTDSPTPAPCMECKNCKLIYNQTTSEYMEINVGDKTGVDSARELTSGLAYSNFDLMKRIIILDECQQMSSQAQNMLLKPIEDAAGKAVHFILCTTEPKKIIKPLRGRCKPVEFRKVGYADLMLLLETICQYEGLEYDNKNLKLIVNNSPSPREAVSSLQQIITAEKIDDSNWIRKFMDQLTEEEEAEIIELARLVNKGFWKPVAQKIKALVKNYSEEQIRIVLASYFTSCLLGAKSKSDADKFSHILGWFINPVYSVRPLTELVHYLYRATKWQDAGRKNG